jgi:hypothetical protein
MDQIMQNLEKLARIRPALAALVQPNLPPRIELQPTKTNLPTLVYRTTQGDKLLHSRYDPLREARSFAATLCGEWDHLILMGMGLGYSVLPLLEQKKPRQRVLVFEPDPAIFSASLLLIDWANLLSSRDDFFIIVGDNEQVWAEEINRFFSLTQYETLQVSYFPGEKTLFPASFSKAEAAIDSQIRTLFYDFKTRLAEGGMVSQNILHNLPHILNTRPVRALKQFFSGHPGIIVSAGPSLDANLHLLKRIHDRAIIIAVDTALKPLLTQGIQPHFTVTADPSYKNYRHMMGTEGRIRHFLLAESAISTRVYEDFTDQIFTVSIGKPLLQFCENAVGPIGELEAWGSVISLAVSLAFHLDLNPLTFIGQDFAYTSMRNHCRHTSWEETLLLENPGIENLQRFERKSISGSIVEKKDIFGHAIYTSDRLALYKDYLVRLMAPQSHRTIFNSSEGGILTERPFLPLEEFIRRFVSHRSPILFDKLMGIPRIGSPTAIQALLKQFASQIRFLKKYKRRLDTLLPTLSVRTPVNTQQLLLEADEVKQSLYRIEEHGNLVEMWSQFPIYTFLASEKKRKPSPEDPDGLRQSLNHYRTYFQSLSQQLSAMIPAFDAMLTTLSA